MVRPIVKDIMFLSRRSEPATAEDLQIAKDLKDTLAAHRESCVGMAANMIGYSKNIIIVSLGFADLVMLNAKITKRSGSYETQEGCLSLTGTRKTIRYQKITVEYQDMQMKEHTQDFSGWSAQIIQHEIDHCSGVII
ncbi:MAG: peptide deformylase [Lachnospiraceae bacterium]|nr:peptide deformylase [Lachnospiraceae bacterium]